MITIDKLKTYEYYGGDADGWIRLKQDSQKISDADWQMIDSLLEDLLLVKNKLTSKQFAEDLNMRLLNALENDLAISYLKSLVGKV